MLLTRARCYILTRSDGRVYGYTEHDRPLLVEGVTCSPVNSLAASSAEQRLGGGIDSIDVATVFNAQHINRAEIEAGGWDSAELRVLLFDWSAGVLVREFLTYAIADAEWNGGEIKVTLESLGGIAVNRKTGMIGAPNCGWRFGDSDCAVDRAANQVPMTVTGYNGTTLSGLVPSATTGQWQTGFAIAGSERMEIVFATAGEVYLVSPFATAPVEGDIITLEPGCGKTVAQCKLFANFSRFGGHGHRAPNSSIVTEVADSQDGQRFRGGSRFES